ncbi:MAG: site-specific integrase, partial [Betaproteobacteria bacterium]|nr:site-specific integrase [Betaproteobacteria bacterium]
VRLKALLSKAVEWGHIEASPIAKLKLGRDTPSGDDAYLTAEEEQALRAALADRDARMIAARESGNAWAAARGYETLPPLKHYADHLTPMVLVAMNTGLRRGELTSLHWEHADLETAVITVLAGKAKSGKARHVPMNAEVIAVLKRWKAVTPHEGDRVFPIESPKTAWNALVEEAGIGKFRFHDLRHHFASRLVMAGEDLNTVRELLGHADIATTLRYAHLAPEHKRKAVDALLAPLGTAQRSEAGNPLELLEQIADPETLRAMLLKLAEKLAH